MIIKGNLNPLQKEAIKFFGGVLFTPQLSKHITVKVSSFKKLDALGYVSILDYNKAYKPREFHILLRNSQSKISKFKTLAHEMVHVKQFAKGEMSPELDMYRGHKFDIAILPYKYHPWEIEAYDTGDWLFTEFLEDLNMRDYYGT